MANNKKGYNICIENNCWVKKAEQKYNLRYLEILNKDKRRNIYKWECNICHRTFDGNMSKINYHRGCSFCNKIKKEEIRKKETRTLIIENKIKDIKKEDYIFPISKINNCNKCITIEKYSKDFADMLIDEGDKKLYISSSKICNFKCPDCNFIFQRNIGNAIRLGLRCPRCSVSMPYSELIMSEVLNQLGINYMHDRKTSWSNNKRYDFLFDDVIIEMHGLQHYNKDKFEFFKKSRKERLLFEDEQYNDKIKKENALNNGINHYIIIDCSITSLSFIKNNILNSELSVLFDLTNIDWEKCITVNNKRIYKSVCELYNENFNAKEISKILGVNIKLIYELLKKSTENKDTEYKKLIIHQSCPVHCITTNKFFESASDASKYYNIASTHIIACCKKKRKAAGTFDGSKLLWEYYIKDGKNEQ